MIKDNIKKLRQEHGLTQSELGRIAGVSDKAVSTWERGDAEPRMGAVEKMAAYFRISKSAIIDNVTVPEARELPILGEICAGDGIFCEENYEGTFCVDNTIKADYCLRVRGDSMIDAGIEAGDMAFIAKTYDFHDGDIYAVLKSGEYTASLKRVYLQADQIVLAACSASYAPEILAAGDVSILGEFVGVYKPKKT